MMMSDYYQVPGEKKNFSLLWFVSLCVHLMVRRWDSRTISGVSGCNKVNKAMTALTTSYSAPGTFQCFSVCVYRLWERGTTLTAGLRSPCPAPTTTRSQASGDLSSASHLRQLSVHNHKDHVPSSNNALAFLEHNAQIL